MDLTRRAVMTMSFGAAFSLAAKQADVSIELVADEASVKRVGVELERLLELYDGLEVLPEFGLLFEHFLESPFEFIEVESLAADRTYKLVCGFKLNSRLGEGLAALRARNTDVVC